MNRPRLLSLAVALSLSCVLPSLAQDKAERGEWRAASTTARGITGDVAILNDKIVINFASFPLAQIRPLTPAEMGAVFNADTNAPGAGDLFRVSIPAEKRFLRKNTLCGSEDTQWVLAYAEGRGLQLALFSGAAIPTLTPEAVANSTSLCGTFSYVR